MRRVTDVCLAAGYEAFNQRFPTDYRAYFIDLDTEKLFRSQMQSLASPSLRLLHSSNAKQVTQYLREKHDKLE